MVEDTTDSVLVILRKFWSLLLFISLFIAWPEYQGKTNLEASPLLPWWKKILENLAMGL